MLEQNFKNWKCERCDCFVTIRIFARTELCASIYDIQPSFVTIRIFARTEQKQVPALREERFVTIRIFARTELTMFFYL